MWKQIAVLCLLVLCTPGASALTPQDGNREKKKRYVIVPREVGLAVVAVQPECPVQFEEVRIVQGVDSHGGATFQLRNRGAKPISSVSYAVISTDGGVLWNSRPGKITNEIVMPGEIVPASGTGEESQEEIVPLTEELRSQLKLKGPMRAVLILMVVRVRYADGTVYSDEATFKALEAYAENLPE